LFNQTRWCTRACDDASSNQLSGKLDSFSDIAVARRRELHDIDALMAIVYLEQLGSRTAKPMVKQHLAAIKQTVRLADQWRASGGQSGGLDARSELRGEARQDIGAVGR
jgi:hypothetical protein